jgi:predicted phage terminase large subunit-like protein
LKRRRVIESRWYREGCDLYWLEDDEEPLTLTSDQNVKTRFENNRRGHMLATSIGGTATGEGGERVLIDDPLNPKEAISDVKRETANTEWDETLSSRLNDPKRDVFVVVMQRLHEKDFTGHLLEEGGWGHIVLQEVAEDDHDIVFPRSGRVVHREGGGVIYEDDGSISIIGHRLWPQRRGDEEIRRAAIHRFKFAGQMQQRPRPREGGMFQGEWFEIVDDWPRDAKVVRSWDLAATEVEQGSDPDHTTGVKVGEKEGLFYIIDLRRLRGSPMSVRNLVKQTAELDGRGVPIWLPQDPGQAGKDQVLNYRRTVLKGFAVRSKTVTGSKVIRADAWNSAAEAGNVKLVRGTWNAVFLEEVTRFPEKGHDDIVDAVSDGHAFLSKRVGRGAVAG